MTKDIRNRATDLQILQEHFEGERAEEDLTPHQKQRLLRVKTVHKAMLKKFKSTFQVMKILRQEFGLSEVQAYRDIRLTNALYGDAARADKEFKRHMAEQMALSTFRKAQREGDLKGMSAANKNYIDATGIKIQDPDLPDFEKLQPSVYVIVADSQTEDMMSKLLQTPGPLNLSKFYNEQSKAAEDAEFTDLTDRSDQGEDTAAP